MFGIIKSVLGFRQFSMRGLERARGEWSLVTMARNIKRMFALNPARGGRNRPNAPKTATIRPAGASPRSDQTKNDRAPLKVRQAARRSSRGI